MSSAMNIALLGLTAFGKKLDVTANNIANVNTNGFKSSRAEMTALYPDGVKVTLSSNDVPGTPLTESDAPSTAGETSNVSLEEEIVNLITTKNMYEANLRTITAEDDMVGELLNIKV